jgi:CrcB protein
MLKYLLLVGSGGFVGSILRYLTQVFFQVKGGSSFPIGTLLVNILGCFIIGILYGLVEKGNVLSPEYRILLTIGFCGGFTTFSSFAFESLQLMKDSNTIYILLYIGLSVFLSIIFAFLGLTIIKMI